MKPIDGRQFPVASERNNKTALGIGDDVAGKPPTNIAKRI